LRLHALPRGCLCACCSAFPSGAVPRDIAHRTTTLRAGSASACRWRTIRWAWFLAVDPGGWRVSPLLPGYYARACLAAAPSWCPHGGGSAAGRAYTRGNRAFRLPCLPGRTGRWTGPFFLGYVSRRRVSLSTPRWVLPPLPVRAATLLHGACGGDNATLTTSTLYRLPLLPYYDSHRVGLINSVYVRLCYTAIADGVDRCRTDAAGMPPSYSGIAAGEAGSTIAFVLQPAVRISGQATSYVHILLPLPFIMPAHSLRFAIPLFLGRYPGDSVTGLAWRFASDHHPLPAFVPARFSRRRVLLLAAWRRPGRSTHRYLIRFMSLPLPTTQAEKAGGRGSSFRRFGYGYSLTPTIHHATLPHAFAFGSVGSRRFRLPRVYRRTARRVVRHACRDGWLFAVPLVIVCMDRRETNRRGVGSTGSLRQPYPGAVSVPLRRWRADRMDVVFSHSSHHTHAFTPSTTLRAPTRFRFVSWLVWGAVFYWRSSGTSIPTLLHFSSSAGRHCVNGICLFAGWKLLCAAPRHCIAHLMVRRGVLWLCPTCCAILTLWLVSGSLGGRMRAFWRCLRRMTAVAATVRLAAAAWAEACPNYLPQTLATADRTAWDEVSGDMIATAASAFFFLWFSNQDVGGRACGLPLCWQPRAGLVPACRGDGGVRW